ncbi:MAG: hypothetical protein HFJ52_07165 [Clostridia bacterium]|nr:hypothetical protein [Clostridia bacterium]
MSDLKKKFSAIIADIEKNIKNKEDLDYVKSQVYNISMLFLDELDKLAEINLGRLNVLIEREKELSKKIANMEKMVNNIEKEVFIPQDCDFEIVCPYCNTEFVEDLKSGTEPEIKCPECGNVIELDWHEEDEECCGHHCGGDCDHEECGNCGTCDDCDDCKEETDGNEENQEDEDM